VNQDDVMNGLRDLYYKWLAIAQKVQNDYYNDSAAYEHEMAG